ncbi:MAG: helix-turn-helix transcriptional regulator [Verrucomicrobia bacterium]|nr:helix-turn-helix transcriptional regulator [Cytophagales bacterium]
MKMPKKVFARQHQITKDYLTALDNHLLDIVEGRATEMLEIKDIADMLHIHPTHLSNTIKLTTGLYPCFFYEEKIMNIAKAMLENNQKTISSIAVTLTYDPSNFTKFFKRFEHKTPKAYREEFLMKQKHQNTETITI